jgi:hypothetical protein
VTQDFKKESGYYCSPVEGWLEAKLKASTG